MKNRLTLALLALAFSAQSALASGYIHSVFVPGLIVTGPSSTNLPYPGEVPGNLSPFSVTPESLSWDGVYVGGRVDKTVVIKNNSSQSIPFQGSYITGTSFAGSSTECPLVMAAGQSCNATVSFLPRTVGSFTGVFDVVAQGYARKSVSLAGTSIGSPLSISPSRLDMGDVNRGFPSSYLINVANVTTGSATFAVPTATAGLGISTTCGLSVPANSSCLVSVKVSSTAALGALSGQIGLTVNAQSVLVPVTATVQESVIDVSTTSLNYGSVKTGLTSSRTVQINNYGNISVALNSISLQTANTAFSAVHNCPPTLDPGTSCSAQVTYAPSATATDNNALLVNTGAAGSVKSVSLIGIGRGPDLSTSLSSIDFGSITKEQSWTRTFTLVNSDVISAKGLTFAYVGTGQVQPTSDCGTELAAAASCTVTVTAAPSAFGAFSGSVTTSFVGQAAPLQVSVLGTVPGVQLQASATALDFAAVAVGDSSKLAVQVLNNSPSSTQVTSVSVNGVAFSAEHDCGLLATGRSCTVNVSYIPTLAGTSSGTLTVAHTTGSSLSVSLGGVGQAATLTVAPNSVALGSIALGAPASANVVVRNTGNIATTVDSASVTGAASLSGTCAALAAGESCTLTVAFDSSTPGDQSAELTVMGNSQIIRVPASVHIGGSAVSVSASTLSFGVVDIAGAPSTLSVLALNSGTDPLTLGSVTVAGSASYTASHNCQSVAPGSSCLVNVQFAPTSPTTLTATISLNPVTGVSATVYATGTGGSNSLSFSGNTDIGVVAPGSVVPQSVTVINNGTFDQAVQSVTAALGTVTANTCVPSLTLTPGQSCTFVFTPSTSAAGQLSQSVSVQTAARSYTRAFSGLVQGSAVTTSTAALAFGTIATNSSAVAPFQISNSGAATTITAVAVSGAGMSISSSAANTCGTGTSFSLAANASCVYAVKYNPTVAGATTGALTFTANGSVKTVALTGTSAVMGYALSGSYSGLSEPVVSSVISNNYVADGVVPTASYTVYLRNILSTANNVSVALNGSSAYQISQFNTVSAAGVNQASSSISSDKLSGSASTTAANPHLRVVLTYTGGQLPSRDLAGLSLVVDGTTTYATTLTTENQASSGAAWSTAFGSALAPAEPFDYGALAVNQALGATNAQLSKTVYLRNNSTHGKLSGVFTLTGDGFTLSTAQRIRNDNSGSVNCAVTANVSVRCVSDDGQNLSVVLKFQPTTPGARSGLLTFTPDATSGMPTYTLAVSGEGRNNVATAVSTGYPATVAPANPVVFATQSVDQSINGTNGTGTQVLYLRNTGTYGMLAGTFAVTGSSAFGLSTVLMTGPDGTGACGATIATNKLSSTTCTAGDASGFAGSHMQHIVASVAFTPTSTGLHNGTLTFTPSPALGLAPISIPLQGNGAYNITYQPSTAVSSVVGPAAPVDLGYLPVNWAVDSTSAAVDKKLFYLAFGTNGSRSAGFGFLSGSVSLSGSTAFKLVGWTPIDDEDVTQTVNCVPVMSSGAMTCPFTSTSGGLCTAEAMGPGYIAGGAGCNIQADNLRATVRFSPTATGQQSAVLTFTPNPGSGLAASSVTLTAEGRYDVNATLSTASASNVAPAAQENIGATPVNTGVDGTTTPLTKTYYVRNTGTAGKLAGSFSLAGNAAYTITSVTAISDNGTAGTACALNTGAQSSTNCTAASRDNASTASTTSNFKVAVQFAPTTTGLQSTVLKFTPVAGTGLSPVSVNITGEGKYDVAYVASLSPSTPTANVPASVDLGSQQFSANVGGGASGSSPFTIYLHQTGTAGALAGTVSITGSGAAAFPLLAWGSITPQSTTNACALPSSSVGSKCVAQSASTVATVRDNLYVMFNYVPTAVGVQNAVLTFTPDAGTGLAPTSWSLQGTGAYNLVPTVSTTAAATTTPASPLPMGTGVTYFNPAPVNSVGALYQDLIFRAIGSAGQLSGTVSLSGSSNYTLSGWGTVGDASSFSNACGRVLANRAGSSCVASVYDSSTTTRKHLQASVMYQPSATATNETATLTFTPHPSTGLSPISVPLTASARNDVIGTATWSAAINSTTAVVTDFSGPAATAATYYVRFPNAVYGATQGTVAVTGNAAWQLASVKTLTASTSAVVSSAVITSNATGILTLGDFSNTGNQVLEVTVGYAANGAGTAALTFTPSSGLGAPVSLTLTTTGATPTAATAITLTPCGATGAAGPTSAQCATAYAGTGWAADVSVVGGFQYWTVPTTGTYSVTVAGAQGGTGGGGTGFGYGATLTSLVSLTAGTQLKIVVGQKGLRQPAQNRNISGGGGGTFVATSANSIISAAGGGGGYGASGGNGKNASLTTSGVAGWNGAGGAGGGGGGGPGGGWGGAGGGFAGAGVPDLTYGGSAGSYFKATAVGGGLTGSPGCGGLPAQGGFGGGGTGGCDGGGGAGGYSGGGAGGGGGGSYTGGTIVSSSVARTGDGVVIIQLQ